MKKILVLCAVLVLAMSIAFTACSDSDSDPAPGPTEIKAGLYNKDNPTAADTPIVAFDKTDATTATTTFNTAITKVKEGGLYTLVLDGDVSAPPNVLNGSLTLTILGLGENRTISLSDAGSLFTVGASANLILDDKIKLKGITDDNTSALVTVNGGTLTMKAGSAITGNTTSGITIDYENMTYEFEGGGVTVKGGTFTMNGGEISGNNSGMGGGVAVTGGTFTMTGGAISGNTVTGGAVGIGGGVGMRGDVTFTMSGGEISGNTATGQEAWGGGVFTSAVFNLTGTAVIKNNKADGEVESKGGGVYLYSSGGTLHMAGSGTIYGSNEQDTSIRNTVGTSGTGAALFVESGGASAAYGSFSGTTWTSSGTLTTTNDTCKLLNGVLQP